MRRAAVGAAPAGCGPNEIREACCGQIAAAGAAGAHASDRLPLALLDAPCRDRPRWPAWAAARSASSTTASATGIVAGCVAERVGRLGRERPGPRLVVEERADRRQPVAEEPQQRPVDQGQRQLGRDRPAELVDGRRPRPRPRSPGPTAGFAGAIVTRRSRSTRTSSRASSNASPAIRAAVSVKFGNCGPVDRPGDGVVALLERHEPVRQDAVGLPGQERRARPAAAVQVDRRPPRRP